MASAGARAVVAWQSVNGDGTAVRGQVHGRGIFTEGFESGDVAVWSASRL